MPLQLCPEIHRIFASGLRVEIKCKQKCVCVSLSSLKPFDKLNYFEIELNLLWAAPFSKYLLI